MRRSCRTSSESRGRPACGSGDPILNAAMSSVTRRAVGDGSWVISRKASSGDITPAVALALASWALAEAPTYDVLESVR